MKTYSTIKEAFENGSGDEFYSKDGMFIAINRKDFLYEEMLSNDFKYISYDDVLKLDETQNKTNHLHFLNINEYLENENRFRTKHPIKIETSLYGNFDGDYNGKDGECDNFPDSGGL